MRGSVWFLLVYKSFIPHISYTRMHCGVPTASFAPFRTSEAPPVYQPCPPSRSVPQKPLPCTNRAPHPVPCLRSPSCVPTVPLTPFRASEAPPVYQPCPPPRSVPQKPLPCTNRVPPSLSVPQKPLLCTNYAPSRSVPQKPLLCTNYAPHPVPYLRSPSRVPTVSLHPVPYRRSPSRVPTMPLTSFVPRINLI